MMDCLCRFRSFFVTEGFLLKRTFVKFYTIDSLKLVAKQVVQIGIVIPLGSAAASEIVVACGVKKTAVSWWLIACCTRCLCLLPSRLSSRMLGGWGVPITAS